jgi:4-amino-4-deoxy-L-arabinose transferase-like glycosyltransferase
MGTALHYLSGSATSRNLAKSEDCSRRCEFLAVLFAAVIFLSGIISPPSLMDDVDSAQAEMARNMLRSGDWVTLHMDGIKYLEKAPAKYWMIAISYRIFGIHDWSARLPIALAGILLCWLVMRMGAWAFSRRVGVYASVALATSVGIFLFTRVLIPDIILTLSIAFSMWALLRALDEDETRPRLWAWLLAASLAAGVLLKGLIGLVFPAGAAFFYLLLTKQLLARRTWHRLRPFTGALIFLAIAAPWHVLATLRNPPYFDLTLHSEPGRWRGFFWFYFINEHVLRFLNERYPRDYNTVPRLWFWLYHLLWFFPWSVFLPGMARLGYKPADRAGRTRLAALCWIGFVMLFFSFSTTQEYYSMPIYPAVALLLGCVMVSGDKWNGVALKVAGTAAALAFAAIAAILIAVRGVPTPGDISNALTEHPSAYTLALGHMQDLTIESFAYLRGPLIVAGIAFLIGAAGAWKLRGQAALLSLAAMMALFFQAARMALVTFDPYMSSRPLADTLKKLPPGRIIFDREYYLFSSVAFYTDQNVLLLNGRVNNLEYGSHAPGAPNVFLTDAELPRLWAQPQRYYLLAVAEAVPRIEKVLGGNLYLIRKSGGKYLFSNQPVAVYARLH